MEGKDEAGRERGKGGERWREGGRKKRERRTVRKGR